jgi:hypothetical protein
MAHQTFFIVGIMFRGEKTEAQTRKKVSTRVARDAPRTCDNQDTCEEDPSDEEMVDDEVASSE